MIKKFVSKNYFIFKSYIYIFLNPEMRYDLRELVFALSLFIFFVELLQYAYMNWLLPC